MEKVVSAAPQETSKSDVDVVKKINDEIASMAEDLKVSEIEVCALHPKPKP